MDTLPTHSIIGHSKIDLLENQAEATCVTCMPNLPEQKLTGERMLW